ncbi:MAG: hypothetical protein ACODAF_08700 [Actinomycetota bacterium]
MKRHDAPRFDLPDEITIGPAVIPAVYVRLAGVAATFGFVWLLAVIFGG